MNIINYIIVKEISLKNLVKIVNEKISEDYEPLGSPLIVQKCQFKVDIEYWYQAMVKRAIGII